MRSARGRGWLAASLAMTAVIGVVGGRVWADGIPDSPATLYYSGYLEDDTGPLAGSTAFRVLLWPAMTGGVSALCDTGLTPVTVMVEDGHFRIPLPADCVDAIHANPNIWVEVTVGGEVLPRQHLGAVPYAVEAARARSLSSPGRIALTTARYNGRITDGALVGYPAARAICQRLLGSETGHMCYGTELARARQEGVSLPAGSTGALYAPEFDFADSVVMAPHNIVSDCAGFTLAVDTCGTMATCFAPRWGDGAGYCSTSSPMLCCD